MWPARLMSPLNDAGAMLLALISAPTPLGPVPLRLRGLALVTVLPLRSMAEPVLTTTGPVPNPDEFPNISVPCRTVMPPDRPLAASSRRMPPPDLMREDPAAVSGVAQIMVTEPVSMAYT